MANSCPKCVEKINALILNTESGFVEADREWLDTLSETALDKIAPKVIEKEKVVEKVIEVNTLSAEDKAALEFGKRQLKERRENWIKGIQANTDKVWTDEKLKVMDDDTLEGIYKSVKKKEDEIVDFSLVVGSDLIQNNNDVEPMLPASYEFKQNK